MRGAGEAGSGDDDEAGPFGTEHLEGRDVANADADAGVGDLDLLRGVGDDLVGDHHVTVGMVFTQGELRGLFDALQLDVIFQPADSALDVAVTLYDRGSETVQPAAPGRGGLVAPPAGIGPATPGLGNQCSIH